MQDLSDPEIRRFENATDIDFDEMIEIATRLLIEVRRHRAAMKRLEEWARALEDDASSSILGGLLAEGLRSRMGGV